MVWVAKEIREEHRQTLDWLNQHTDGNIDFYAVIVEIVQIDDSRPACSFKLVAFPNEYRKSAIKSKGGGTTTERGEAYRAFFQDLIDQLRDKHRFTGARVAVPQNGYSFASGISGIGYGAAFASKEQVRTEIYIDFGDTARNKASSMSCWSPARRSSVSSVSRASGNGWTTDRAHVSRSTDRALSKATPNPCKKSKHGPSTICCGSRRSLDQSCQRSSNNTRDQRAITPPFFSSPVPRLARKLPLKRGSAPPLYSVCANRDPEHYQRGKATHDPAPQMGGGIP